MAQVMSFMFAETLQPVKLPPSMGFPQGRTVLHLVNPVGLIYPISIPSNYSLAVSFIVYDFDAEANNTLQAYFYDSKNEMIFSTEQLQTQNFSVNVTDIPVNEQSVVFNIEMFNLPLYYEGRYRFSITLNAEEIGTFFIPVYARKSTLLESSAEGAQCDE